MLHQFQIKTGAAGSPAPFLFVRALGTAFAGLPAPVEALHHVMGHRRWVGQVTVMRGQGVLARIVAAIMRFSPASTGIPVTVVMQRVGNRERCTRHFGIRRFHSTMRLQDSVMTERFGRLRFGIGLRVQDGALHYPVTDKWRLGVLISQRLLPVCLAAEVG